jgi:tRNA (guanosine-2'-O-)-methyltransferase
VLQLDHNQKKDLVKYLSEFVLEERKKRFDEVLQNRISHMQIVLEDVYQAHNASAVVRSADCFGVQYLHFVEHRNRYKISGDVALGASQWVHVTRHSSTATALTDLKSKGYRIVATTPHKNDKTIFDYDVTQKFALVFGTEKLGITNEVMEMADDFVKIPMMGFTESFNISVCAALFMQEFSHRIRRDVKNPYLTEEQKLDTYIQWLLQTIRKSDLVLKDYIKKHVTLSGK